MAETATDTANNETGAEEVVPTDLYDDEGGESKDEAKTGDETKGDESKDDASKEDKAGDDKSDDKDGKEGDDKGDKEDEGAPEKYDLKLAEDSILDQKDVDEIAARARELDLSNEDAQLMVDMEAEAQERYHGKLEAEVSKIHEGWIKTAQTDEEIGGDAFKENVELAHRVLEKFGTKEFNQMLKDSNYGNHPEVIRIFARLGKQMASDEAVFGSDQSGEKPIEDVFYNNTNKD